MTERCAYCGGEFAPKAPTVMVYRRSDKPDFIKRGKPMFRVVRWGTMHGGTCSEWAKRHREWQAEMFTTRGHLDSRHAV